MNSNSPLGSDSALTTKGGLMNKLPEDVPVPGWVASLSEHFDFQRETKRPISDKGRTKSTRSTFVLKCRLCTKGQISPICKKR